MDFVTIGETMAAFVPKEHGKLRYISGYQVRIAGAESNFAIGAKKLGCSARWISRVGKDEFGEQVLRAVRAEGVEAYAAADPDYRTGLMFKETSEGSETKVTYYRENSAASHLSPDDIREEWIADAKILHITGITPVLSESCRETIDRAMLIAEKHSVKISFDPNIRRKLWKGRDYTELIREYLSCAHYVLIGKDEAQVLYGTGEIERLREILFSSGRMEYLALKDGAKGATVASKEEIFPIPPYPCNKVDPIGAGDAFDAAFLVGMLEGKPLSECGFYGAVAGAKATETRGDIEGYLLREELEQILGKQETVYR
jgi:2-dehydro-3-deoxygluconokinase